MTKIVLKNASIVNEGTITHADIHIKNGLIQKIGSISSEIENTKEIDCTGHHILPGVIDAHVHFREPGYEYKGTIHSETMAALAGGITSYMEMPNTNPPCTSLDLLEQKYKIAAQQSLCNYSFFLGLTTDNLDQVKAVDNEIICGVSDDGLHFGDDGKMLANHPEYLEKIFSNSSALIALHCEDENVIKFNEEMYKSIFEADLPAHCHALIRNSAECYNSFKRVTEMAERFNSRLHILHISTEEEAEALYNNLPIAEKKITGEVCIPHLWFSQEDYEKFGYLIKWNPSIKKDNTKLLKALKSNKLDMIATDHAPHLLSEKLTGNYFTSKSGSPIIQESLLLLLELYHKEQLSLFDIVKKTSHDVAEVYRMQNRGYIREGYHADLVRIELNTTKSVPIIPYTQCGWSLFPTYNFKSRIVSTFVNGHLMYDQGSFRNDQRGQRLRFSRDR